MKNLLLLLFFAISSTSLLAQYDIYWADKSSSNITTMNEAYDATMTLFENVDDIGRIKIDPVSQQLFWLEQSNGTIYASTMERRNKMEILDVNTKVSVLSIDELNQKIYFTEDQNNRIMRADIDGNNLEVFATGVGLVKGIVFDQSNQQVFFTDLLHGSISKKGMHEGDAQVIYTNEDYIMYDLAIDHINEQLYFSERAENNIARIDFDGNNVATIIELNSLAGALAIDADFSKIFYKEGDQINSANLDGTDIMMLTEGVMEISGLDIFNESMVSPMAQKK